MASILYHSAILSGVGCWTEHRYWSRSATKGSPAAGTEELAAFLLTPTILFGVGYWAVLHGFLVVGKAREKYMAQARADGEENVEERYGLPNLYAQGTSPHARAFNCVQRSHQHIFETYPLVVISGMLGAIGFPLTTALSTLSYAVGRYLISRDYARGEGDPKHRYNSPLARSMWYGLFTNSFVAMISSGMILLTGCGLLCRDGNGAFYTRWLLLPSKK